MATEQEYLAELAAEFDVVTSPNLISDRSTYGQPNVYEVQVFYTDNGVARQGKKRYYKVNAGEQNEFVCEHEQSFQKRSTAVDELKAAADAYIAAHPPANYVYHVFNTLDPANSVAIVTIYTTTNGDVTSAQFIAKNTGPDTWIIKKLV